MKVTVKFFTTLREIADKREEEIELSGDTTVEQLMEQLSKKYGPRFKDYLQAFRRSQLQVLVNGRNMTTLQGFKTKLREGDSVAIIPPVGGG